MNCENVMTTTLSNGLEVVTQRANFNNVYVGAFIKVGLENETDEENGLSHFLEHMLFKGTETQNSFELANSIEKLGGSCNAYTSNDTTVVYATLLPEHWKQGVDFVLDVTQNAVFPEEDIARESAVILEEIAMYENDSGSEMMRQFLKHTYECDPLGRQIIGTRANVQRFNRDDLLNYYKKWYIPTNMVISACGNVDHDEFVKYVEERFRPVDTFHELPAKKPNIFKPGVVRRQNIFNQSHFILGVEGFNALVSEEEKITWQVLSNVLDGGMSCRLFQTIREKYGLAYGVSVIGDRTETTGYFGIYAALEEKKIDHAIELAKHTLNTLKSDITEEELQQAKNKIVYSISHNYDSFKFLAMANGSHVLFGLPTPPRLEEIKDMLQGITREKLFTFANKYIPNEDEDDKFSLSIMTPWEKIKEI